MSKILLTKAGLYRFQAEQTQLSKDRPEAVSNLQKARELGDLSENGYYKEAKARLSFIDSRISHLNRLLRQAELISLPTQESKIQLGHTVTLESNGQTYTYTLVGEQEADPSLQTISPSSPLGALLLGQSVGQTLSLNLLSGTRQYTIKTIKISHTHF